MTLKEQRTHLQETSFITAAGENSRIY